MTLDEMRAALGREDEIPFEPVPRQRKRRNGWSEAAQRDFIAALSLTGSVRAAAEVVGLSPRSAYRLAAAPGGRRFRPRLGRGARYRHHRNREARERFAPLPDLGGTHSVTFVTFGGGTWAVPK